MRSVKQILSILLCLVLAGLSASCAHTQPPMPSETTTTMPTQTNAATSAVPVQTTLSDPSVAAQPGETTLRPTQEDLDTLCTILFGEAFFSADYDCRTDNVLDYLYNNGLLFELLNMEGLGLLQEGENLFRVYQGSGEEDPLGCFADGYFIRVQADVLDAYMENTFCNTVYKEHTTFRDSDGNVGYYLHDGWYYFHWCISGMEGITVRAAKYQEDDGRLQVTVNEYYADPGEEDDAELIVTLSVDAALRAEGDTHAWSIYSVKNTYHKYSYSAP